MQDFLAGRSDIPFLESCMAAPVLLNEGGRVLEGPPKTDKRTKGDLRPNV